MSIKLGMAHQMRAAGLPEPAAEHRFAPPRRWRFDWCWPAYMVALEREGGTWKKGGGRHQRGSGFARDCEKYSAAAVLGWAVIRYTVDMERSGKALEMIEAALRARGWEGGAS